MKRNSEFDEKHPRGQPSNPGQFAKKPKQAAALPPVQAINLGGQHGDSGLDFTLERALSLRFGERHRPEPHKNTAEEQAKRKLNDLVDQALASGFNRQEAEFTIGLAVTSAAKSYDLVCNDEHQELLLGIGEEMALSRLTDHYQHSRGDRPDGGDLLQEMEGRWRNAASLAISGLGCRLDEFQFDPQSSMVDVETTSTAVNGDSEIGWNVVGDTWSVNERTPGEKNRGGGIQLDLTCGRDSRGVMQAKATVVGYWCIPEIGEIRAGDYDSAFDHLESNVRAAATD